MELKQMRYFCSVISEGSFTKAAEKNLITQSAISQQVKALEADLEIELLARQGRSFTLTPAGEHFYRRAQAILADIDSLRKETLGLIDMEADAGAIAKMDAESSRPTTAKAGAGKDVDDAETEEQTNASRADGA